MSDLDRERRAYEDAVRGLAATAAELLRSGSSVEFVARSLVPQRNALKVRYRAPLDPTLLRLLEQRNRAKYGDPVGPSADWLFIRYGDWESVTAAACRPSRIASEG